MTEPTKREIELEMENCQLRNEIFQLSGQLLQYQVQENRQRFDVLQRDYIQIKELNPVDNPEPAPKDENN
ncbi:hypothetical protein SB6424_00196 [Klebsiella pasteurii]|uniref:hypothetical protein n=1 Tax=Klebsiella pasteurii TaxID=2587529 RepID=UPI001158E5F4|nr:hypothetical protein [Klebsiella pasteurii]VUS58795.1 hypothetical protein SB6424_00196 [Klebsiella pasteurii]